MKSLLNKVASTVAGVVLFCLGCVMAGLGLSVVALLAMFAMAAAGLAILASPFITLTEQNPHFTVEDEEAVPAA